MIVLVSGAAASTSTRLASRKRLGLHAAAVQFDGRRNSRDDFFVLPGFGNEIGGTALHGFDDCIDTAMRCNHDNDHLRIDLQDALEPLEPLHARGLARPEIHVEQNRVKVVLTE